MNISKLSVEYLLSPCLRFEGCHLVIGVVWDKSQKR